mmetsp:Transcript_28022/g.42948  ORF Transcript_28022/g.42948 Transcript_28022/m.42948 type:complete len:86 (+) Transcript_28022:1873-2130(+)
MMAELLYMYDDLSEELQEAPIAISCSLEVAAALLAELPIADVDARDLCTMLPHLHCCLAEFRTWYKRESILMYGRKEQSIKIIDQ